jgi:hypothetical protein
MTQVCYETWGNISVDQDVDTISNSFLNTYLRTFYSSFPKKQVMAETKSNPWMTHGIKISCQHKRELYLTLRNSNDPNLKCYYKIYCKILSNVIKAAKNLHYNRVTFKRQQFKCHGLSADWNLLWGFKHLLLWLGKF